MDLHDCMIFSNFKFVRIFGISKFYMNFMNRFSVMHRASDLRKIEMTECTAPLMKYGSVILKLHPDSDWCPAVLC
jgi:hypothetical protein